MSEPTPSGRSAPDCVKGFRPSSGARCPNPLDASRPVGEVLPGLWAAICRAAPPWRARLNEEWAGIVGERFAKRLRPGPSEGMDRQTLIVYADHSAIRFEAEREMRDLAARIREAVPEAPVRRVRFQVDQPQSDSG